MSDYYPKELFHELVLNNIRKYGNTPALVHDNNSINFNQIPPIVDDIVLNLRKNEIKKGDAVMVCLQNSIWYPLIFLACAKIGAIMSGINPETTSYELKYYLSETKAKLLFTTDDFLNKNKWLVTEIKLEILITDVTACFPTQEDSVINLDPLRPLDIDTVLLAPFSSGTTGLPKCCSLTHRNFLASTYSLKSFLFDKLIKDSNRKTLAFLPFYHASGFWALLICLLEGCTTYIMPEFHPIMMTELIEKHEIDTINIVPAIANCLLELDFLKGRCQTLRNVLCGSSGLSKQRCQKFLELFPQITNFIQGYGMTELVVLSHVTPFNDDFEHLGSCGQLLPGFEAKVSVDEYGQEELLLKSDAIMKKYMNGVSNLDEDGWLHTGDIVTKEGDFYYIVDRKKDLIKENFLLTINGVKEAAVIGIDDPVCGQAPKGFIVLADGFNKEKSLATVESSLRNKLSSIKQLRGGIVIVDELPKSGSGKVQKNQLNCK